MKFETVLPPSWHATLGADATIQEIDRWLGSEALRQLVAVFGGRHSSGSPAECASYLDEFASTNWDFRKGQERDNATRVRLDASQTRAALAASAALGLRGHKKPTKNHYDAVLILGGLARACIVRPAYAKQLLDDGLSAKRFSALSAFRPLGEAELAIATRLQIMAHDEYDVMVEGMRRAFSSLLIEPPTVDGAGAEGAFDSWRQTSWEWSSDIPRGAAAPSLSVVAAPATVPGKRANSTDTYDYWARNIKPPDVTSVLLITNPIYVVYQGIAAIENLGLKHRLSVETVGISDQAADLGKLTQVWQAQDYLQEIRSSISALARLRISLVNHSTQP